MPTSSRCRLDLCGTSDSSGGVRDGHGGMVASVEFTPCAVCTASGRWRASTPTGRGVPGINVLRHPHGIGRIAQRSTPNPSANAPVGRDDPGTPRTYGRCGTLDVSANTAVLPKGFSHSVPSTACRGCHALREVRQTLNGCPAHGTPSTQRERNRQPKIAARRPQ